MSALPNNGDKLATMMPEAHHDAWHSAWVQRFHNLEAPAFPSTPSSPYTAKEKAEVVKAIREVSWPEDTVERFAIVATAWSILVAVAEDVADVVFGAAFASTSFIGTPLRATIPRDVPVQQIWDTISKQLAVQSSEPINQDIIKELRALSSDIERAFQYNALLVNQPLTESILKLSERCQIVIGYEVEESQLCLRVAFDPVALDARYIDL